MERETTPTTPSPVDDLDAPDNVTAELVRRVTAWAETAARRLKHDGCDAAVLTLTAHDPGWDDDNTCMMTVRIEEQWQMEEVSGRVEGVK